MEKSVAAPATKAAAIRVLSGSPEGGGASSFVVSLVVLPLPLLLPPFFFCFVGIAGCHALRASCTHTAVAAGKYFPDAQFRPVLAALIECPCMLSHVALTLQRWRCVSLGGAVRLAACKTLARRPRRLNSRFKEEEGLGRRARRVLRAKFHYRSASSYFELNCQPCN